MEVITEVAEAPSFPTAKGLKPSGHTMMPDKVTCSDCGAVHTDDLMAALGKNGYYANREIGTSMSQLLNGRKPATIILQGPPGCGKAQPLDAIVHTPSGPRYMGSMEIGDTVCTPDGTSAQVIAVHPQGDRPVYEITFADGRKVRADENHLWKVKGKKFEDKRTQRMGWDLVTTKRLYSSFLHSKGYHKISVPLSQPVESPSFDLPVDPWLMGYLLGNGMIQTKRVSFSTRDSEVVERITDLVLSAHGLGVSEEGEYGYRIAGAKGKANAMIDAMRELGTAGSLSYEKVIPDIYMRAGTDQRRALVQGLMDSDGTAGKGGSISFCSTSQVMAKQLQELIWSLGGVAAVAERQTYFTHKGEKKPGRLAYQVNIRHPEPSGLFTIERKRERCADYQYADTLALTITDIQYVGEEPTQCITIDHPEHLYLTDGYVVTHNSFLPECLAQTMNVPFIEYLCHSWTTDEDFFSGVDVPAAVAGDHENVARPGVLAMAAEASKRGRVILLLDEIDKAPEKVESLLLQFLQSGRVPIKPGVLLQADTSNLLVFLTSNRKRELMEATLRRGFRLDLTTLPPSIEADLLRKRTGAPISLIRSVVNMANLIRTKGASIPSMQEAEALLIALNVASCKQDCMTLLRGWLVKQPADWQILQKTFTHPENALFGAVLAARRERGQAV